MTHLCRRASLICLQKRKTSDKGDTNGVSVKGTPILKSLRGTDELVKKHSLGKAKIRLYVNE